MTSLFARIFLWFWGLMLLIMLVTGGTVTFIAWHRFSAVAEFNPAQASMAAQSALDAQGAQGLRHWLEERAQKDGTVAIFALDPSGRDLLARNVPPMIRNAPSPWRGDDMREMQAWGRPAFMQKRSHILLSSLLVRQGRPAYWLIAAWSGSTPFDVLGSSDAWIALIALFVVLGSILCWVLARGISQPIVALQDRARRLAKGDFDATMGPSLTRRRDEIGQLAAEFNQMAEQIRDQLASKEMLLRDISHELRSPLTRLRVAAGLARAKGGEIDLHIERIERDIERLDRLIDDTLRFSMVTTPGLAIALDSIDLAELAGKRCAMLKSRRRPSPCACYVLMQTQFRSQPMPTCSIAPSTMCCATPFATRPWKARSPSGFGWIKTMSGWTSATKVRASHSKILSASSRLFTASAPRANAARAARALAWRWHHGFLLCMGVEYVPATARTMV
jgi:two-component system sensor histidine kinase CpxA